MAITPYNGQPLPPGTIICRRSVMTNGFSSAPIEVVFETPNGAVIRDLIDDDERRCRKSTIAFICDTKEEGEALFKANLEYLAREQAIAQRHATERFERRLNAIAAAIEAAA